MITAISKIQFQHEVRLYLGLLFESINSQCFRLMWKFAKQSGGQFGWVTFLYFCVVTPLP